MRYVAPYLLICLKIPVLSIHSQAQISRLNYFRTSANKRLLCAHTNFLIYIRSLSLSRQFDSRYRLKTESRAKLQLGRVSAENTQMVLDAK
jgi:hypothetical protein